MFEQVQLVCRNAVNGVLLVDADYTTVNAYVEEKGDFNQAWINIFNYMFEYFKTQYGYNREILNTNLGTTFSSTGTVTGWDIGEGAATFVQTDGSVQFEMGKGVLSSRIISIKDMSNVTDLKAILTTCMHEFTHYMFDPWVTTGNPPTAPWQSEFWSYLTSLLSAKAQNISVPVALTGRGQAARDLQKGALEDMNQVFEIFELKSLWHIAYSQGTKSAPLTYSHDNMYQMILEYNEVVGFTVDKTKLASALIGNSVG